MNAFTKGGLGTRVMAVAMVMVMMFGVFGTFGAGAVNANTSGPVVVAKADNISDIIDGAISDTSGTIKGDNNNVIAGGGDGLSNKKDGDITTAGDLVNKTKVIVQIITGCCTAIAIGALVVNIGKMAISSGNDSNRKKAQTGILWSGIALAAFGGLTAVVTFFWNFLAGV